MNQKTNKFTYEKDFLGVTRENGEITRIPATVDFMFKNLFGVNGKEENLKGLLQAILKIKIDSLEIQNPELPREHKEDKLGIVDVKAKLSNGTMCSIEMQVKNERNLGERMTFYVCKLYINTLELGSKYKQATKTIAIAIINFSYFNRKEYHQIAHLQFEECKDKNEIVDEILKGEESKILTDKLEVHIIDLHKFKKMKEPKGELADWLNLILGNEEGIEMASKRNEMISKINEENKELSKDQQLKQRLAELSIQMAIMDENNRKAYEEEEREQRRKEIREKVRKEVREEVKEKVRKEVKEEVRKELEEAKKEAQEKGISEGITKGERKKQLEIAKKLLVTDMPIEQISEITGLAMDEIKKEINIENNKNL